MVRRILVCVMVLISLWAGPAMAGSDWEMDAAHSSVRFAIRHIASYVTGGFDDFSGVIRFDPDNLPQSKIRITIETASVNTGIDKRDDHLRTADFFDVEKYPVITFESDAIIRKEGSSYEARGRLTIKDVTREIVLPFTLLNILDHPDPEQKCLRVAGIESRLNLNRLDYHVGDGKWFRMGMVGDDVRITIYVEALQKKEGCEKNG